MAELKTLAPKKWVASFGGIAPTLDSSNDIHVGDIAVDNSITPNILWTCSNNALGAPVWVILNPSAATAIANLGLATVATTGSFADLKNKPVDATNASNISSGTLDAARLAASGVTAGTTGSATAIPVITVDDKGRVTGVSSSAISVPNPQVQTDWNATTGLGVLLNKPNLAPSATTDATTTANISDSSNKRFITDAQRTLLFNTSGTNSGDETTSSIGIKLSANSTNISALGNLTGVNSGDETASSIESKLGVSATNATALGNLTGVNSGDETTATIKTKLGAATNSVDGYLTAADHTTFNAKQAALGFTAENVANKSTDGTFSGNSDALYPSQKATKTYVDSSISAAIRLQGDWNASTNTPDITGTTTTGFAWRVSTTGTTSLGGLTAWSAGDMAVKTATGWMRVDSQDIAAVWGNISGTLSNQSDLNTALGNKVSTSTTVNGHALSSNVTVSASDVGLGSVENTALSTWVGTSNITTVGTIATGVWNGTTLADGKIASALTGKTYNGITPTALTSGFTLAGGTSTSYTVTVAGSGSLSGTNTGDQVAANPTGSINGAAVNGTASTFMRSDAAPALSATAVTAGSYTSTNLTVDAYGRITAAANGSGGTGGSGSSLTVTITQANTFTAGTPIYYNTTSSTWIGSMADTAADAEVVGIVQTATSSSFTMVTSGLITLSGLTPGLYYVSATSAALTATEPSVGYVSKPVMYAFSSTQGIVMNMRGEVYNGVSTPSAVYGTPIGTISYFTGLTAPAGWLVVNGGPWSRTAYAPLWQFAQAQIAAGNTFWNVGDGSSTFGCANLQDYFLAGASSSYPVGTVRADQMQGHFHSVSQNYALNQSAGSIAAGATIGVLGALTIGSPATDGTNGTPRTGTKTFPQHVTLLPCVKYADVSLSQASVSPLASTNSLSDVVNPDLARANLGISGKNKLVNGAFQFWQIGTSSSAGYLADQWFCGGSGTVTYSQTAINAGGCQYGLKWTTGAASSYGLIAQPLEQAEVIPLRGQTVTFSIYVSATSLVGTMTIYVNYSTSSDTLASQTTAIALTSPTFTPTGTLTRYSVSFTVPATATGLLVGLYPSASQASGVSVTHAMAQLEIGSVATPFECYPYALELQRCQRFYEKSYDVATAPGTAMVLQGCEFFYSSAATLYGSTARFKTTKRATPTCVVYSYQTGATGKIWSATPGADVAATFQQIGTSQFGIYANAVGTSTNVDWHWTANAQL